MVTPVAKWLRQDRNSRSVGESFRIPEPCRRALPVCVLALGHDADVTGIDEIGNSPAVRVVLAKAGLDEVGKLPGQTARNRGHVGVQARQLIASGVVALIEFVTAAELCSESVPDQLHHLDPRFGRVPVRASYVLAEVLADLGYSPVHGIRVGVDECAGQVLLEDLLNPRVRLCHHHPVDRRSFDIWHDRSVCPGSGLVHHRIYEAPEQVTVHDYLTDSRLHAAEVLGTGHLEPLDQQPAEEVELYRKADASLQQGAEYEPGA